MPSPSPTSAPSVSPTIPVFENAVAYLGAQIEQSEKDNLSFLIARFWGTVLEDPTLLNMGAFGTELQLLGLDQQAVFATMVQLVNAANGV